MELSVEIYVRSPSKGSASSGSGVDHALILVDLGCGPWGGSFSLAVKSRNRLPSVPRRFYPISPCLLQILVIHPNYRGSIRREICGVSKFILCGGIVKGEWPVKLRKMCDAGKQPRRAGVFNLTEEIQVAAETMKFLRICGDTSVTVTTFPLFFLR
jgi:hypothetical protein